MVDEARNKEVNQRLKELYESNSAKHREIWEECYGKKAPTRINEFGIIDVKRYDSKEGILVIGRETNGESWYKNNFVGENALFIEWMNKISKKEIHLPARPNIWYNTARFIKTVRGENEESLSCANKDLLPALGTVAFTNINKVGGGSKSGGPYWEMYKTPEVIRLVAEEIEIIKPKYIILCDKYFADFLKEKNILKNHPALKKSIDNNRFYVVDHPAARMSKEKMLVKLEEQIKGE